MNNSTQQQEIEAFINEHLAEDPDTFLVKLEINAGNIVGVYLDTDKGITIDKCTKLNRALYKFIEEKQLFGATDFALEVSSPGVDEPLRMVRQYKKNIGRSLHVTLIDDNVKEGKLISAGEEQIVIEEKEGKGKKAITKTTTIFYTQIKHAVVLITF
ncbi:ribosome assembly cofactor RimP [soil metagenome]